MAPIVLGILALAAGGLAYEKFKKPAYQSQAVLGPGGVQLHVVTPIAPDVTPSQRTGVPTPPAPKPALHPAHAPAPAVAQVVPGQGTVYAPPKMVDTSTPGSFQMAPIIVSPTGSSSVAIGSVLDIQKALNCLGFVPRLKEDGKFGPATSSNIRAFQGKNGLAVDGNAGPATKAGLSNALAAFISSGPSTVTVAESAQSAVTAGKASPVVTARDVQHALNLLGAKPPLLEDGKPGPKTVAGIRSFQLSHGLTVDGVAGPKTKAALAIAVQAPVAAAGQFNGGFG